MVYGVVTDGTLTVGIKCIGGTKSGRWPLWDNFRLTYVGMDLKAIQEMIASYADEVEELQDEMMGADVLSALNSTYAAGETAATGEDAFAALTALVDVLADAKECVKVYGQLEDAINTLSGLIESNPNSSAVDAAVALCQNTSSDFSEGAYNTAEATAQLAILEDMCAQMRVPTTDNASDDNPVDFTQVILNNGFESGNLTGWTDSGTVKAQAQNNTSFDNKQGDYYCEKWHVTGTININQTVAYLPAGKYEISAYVYSEAPDAVLYANDEKVSVSTSGLYTVGVVLEEPGAITLGVSWTDDGSKWTCLDEFTMNYYGIPTLIKSVEEGSSSPVNGKYFQNGQIIIIKNGVKYNVAGQAIK